MNVHKLSWLDWITILFCLWFLFYPKPYEILFSILLLLPIIGLLINGYSKPSLTSLVTLSSDKEGNDYDTSNFIVLPALILIVRMALDFEIESYLDLLIKGLIGLVVLLLLVGFLYRDIDKAHKKKSLVYFAVIGNLTIYSFGAVWGINCVYDHTAAKVYKSVVTEKSMYKGKHTSYYLYVEPWSDNSDNNKIKVTEQQYSNTQVGDTVTIDRQEGLLKIPWHYIEERK